MIKKLAIFLISSGLLLVGIGSFELFKSNKEQEESLNEAYKVIEVQKHEAGEIAPSVFSPNQGETVGILEIPKIDGKLPIVEGTDEDELEKGVGHYKGTAYPSQNDQIVLSGHRDTVFRRMGELEIGDIFIIHLPYGSFKYEIRKTKIVNADDRTVIKSTAPNEELIVTTCYPFSYIGNAPERYILTAYPVKAEKSDH